jgi:predicted nucleotidyltransferase
MNDSVKVALAKLHECLEALYGKQLDRVILYGSQARGDAKADSDVDVLIVLKEPFNYSHEIERLSFLVSPICLEHNVVISYAFVTIQQFQQSNNAFFRNVQREGVFV